LQTVANHLVANFATGCKPLSVGIIAFTKFVVANLLTVLVANFATYCKPRKCFFPDFRIKPKKIKKNPKKSDLVANGCKPFSCKFCNWLQVAKRWYYCTCQIRGCKPVDSFGCKFCNLLQTKKIPFKGIFLLIQFKKVFMILDYAFRL